MSRAVGDDYDDEYLGYIENGVEGLPDFYYAKYCEVIDCMSELSLLVIVIFHLMVIFRNQQGKNVTEN